MRPSVDYIWSKQCQKISFNFALCNIQSCLYHVPLISMTRDPPTYSNSMAPFKIKMTCCYHRKSWCGDKTAVRSSHLHNGISYVKTDTTPFLLKRPHGGSTATRTTFTDMHHIPCSFGSFDHQDINVKPVATPSHAAFVTSDPGMNLDER